MKCLNIKLKGVKELVDKYGYTKTSKVLEAHFPNHIPTVEEFDQRVNTQTKFIKESPNEPIASKPVAIKILDRLETKLKGVIKYKIVTDAEYRKLNPNWYNEGSPAYYDSNGTIIIPEKLSGNVGTLVHEFAHPLLDAVEKLNPGLLDKLYDDFSTKPEAKQIEKDVRQLYKEHIDKDFITNTAIKEMLVRYIELKGKENIDARTGEIKDSVIRRIFLAIRQGLRHLFGRDVKVSKLDMNTTLEQLADMLTVGNNTIDLETEFKNNNLERQPNKTEIEIKPGVQELFESNPELANAVYEALGFKNKIENPNNIILKEEKTNDSLIRFSITGNNNLEGAVTLYKNEEEKVIYVHDIGINIKNKGYGTTIYNLLAEKFNKEGYTLGSTSAIYTVGEGSRKVWDKLVKQNKAVIVELPLTDSQLFSNEMRKKVGSTELIEKNLQYRYINSQITSQQKQQALQLYSQYLDTIFLDSKVKDIVYHGTIFDFPEFSKKKLGRYTQAPSASQGFFFTDNKLVSDSYIKPERIKDQEWIHNQNQEFVKQYGRLENTKILDNKIEELKDLLKPQNNIAGLTPNKPEYYNDSEYIIYKERDDSKFGGYREEYGWNELKGGSNYRHFYNISKNKYEWEKVETKDVEKYTKLYYIAKGKENLKYDTKIVQKELDWLEYVKDLFEQGEDLPNLPIKFYWELKNGEYYGNRELLNTYIINKYAEIGKTSYRKPEAVTKTVLLNAKNPLTFDYEGEKYRSVSYFDKLKEAQKNNNDSAILENTFDSGFLKEDEYKANIYVVFEPSQIHILGNKQDIEGFKEFVENNKSENKQLSLQEQFDKVDKLEKEWEEFEGKTVGNVKLIRENYRNSAEVGRNLAIKLFGKENVSEISATRGNWGQDVYSYTVTKPNSNIKQYSKTKKTEEDEFNDVSQENQEIYSQQLEDYEWNNGEEASKEMKSAATKILILQNKIKFIDKSHEYIFLKTNKKFKSVTEELEKEKRFKFNGDEKEFEINKQWGNQIDFIFRRVILGDDIELCFSNLEKFAKNRGLDTLMTKDVLETLHKEFTKFKDDNKKSLILIQQVLYNEEAEVAGTPDIILINPDGKIQIVDLKSSINPTGYKDGKFTNYVTKSGFKNKYDQEDNGRGFSSRKDKHSAQLSIYKGLALSKGLVFTDNNSLGILPVHILTTEEEVITEVKKENEFPLSGIDKYISKYSSDKHYDGETQELYETELGKYIKNIRKILENRLLILNRRQNRVNDIEKKQIEKLTKSIAVVEKIEGIADFIESLYDLYVEKVGKTNTFPGISKRIERTIKKMEDGDLEGVDAINELQYYRETIDLYSDTIDDLLTFFEKNDIDFKNEEGESLLGKLNSIKKAERSVIKDYKSQINPLIAKELTKYVSEGANANLREELEGKRKRLEIYKKLGKTKLIENLEKEIKKLNNKFGEGVTYERILKELNEGADVDLNMIDTNLNPAINSSNSIIALFAKSLKQAFEKNRSEMFDFGREASDAFEKFKKFIKENPDNNAKFNDGLYEKIVRFKKNKETGEWEREEELAFIQEIDISKFNEELNQAHLKYKKLKEEGKVELARQFIKNWYEENTEKLQKEDTVYNGIVVKKGADSLMKEKLEQFENNEISQYDLNNWFNKVYRKDEDDNEYWMADLAQPKKSKYTNAKFKELESNTEKFKYYKFLVGNYFKFQHKTPENSRLGYILPYVNKTNRNRIRENGILNYVKYKYNDLTKELPQDLERYGERDTQYKTIPVVYTRKIPLSDVSLDLISSVMLYGESAIKFETQSNLRSYAEATAEAARASGVYKTDSLGNKIANSVAKKLKLTNSDLYLKQHGETNISKLLEAFIDMQIYGKHSHKTEIEFLGRKRDIGKIVNGLMAYGSFTTIGGNPLGAFANYLTATSNATIEASANQFFSFGEYEKSRLIYDKHALNGDFLKDFNSPVHKSLIGQLIDIYDPLQGKFKDKYGRKISNTLARKLFSSDTWFFMQHQGEHNVQVRTLIASLLKRKVKDKDGKLISLLDAYEPDKTGKIKLKDGIKLDGLTSFGGLVDVNLQNQIHAINKQLHGVYDEFNKTIIEREWWGRMLLMYRKFVVPGFKRRYKNYGIDQEAGIFYEGYMRTFYRLAWKETNELLKQLSPFSTSNLTPSEKANVKRAATEMAYMLTTGAIIMILNAMAKSHPEDKKKYRYLLYYALRLNNEIGFFQAPGDISKGFLPDPRDMYRSFRSPSASYTTVERTIKFVSQLLSHPTEEYQRDSGLAKKGDNKVWIDFLKLIGRTGNTDNPEQASQQLQRSIQ